MNVIFWFITVWIWRIFHDVDLQSDWLLAAFGTGQICTSARQSFWVSNQSYQLASEICEHRTFVSVPSCTFQWRAVDPKLYWAREKTRWLSLTRENVRLPMQFAHISQLMRNAVIFKEVRWWQQIVTLIYFKADCYIFTKRNLIIIKKDFALNKPEGDSSLYKRIFNKTLDYTAKAHSYAAPLHSEIRHCLL